MLQKTFLVAFSLFAATAFSVGAETQTEPSEPSTSATSQQTLSLPESGLPAEWLQGAPVSRWEKDKVYIFELWATWCGPCLAAIPHIEAIHQDVLRKKLPVQIIGVNIRDRADPKTLKNFLAKRNTPPTYTIAVDTKKNTETEWLKPLKVVGIPFAFAVKNGNVLWKGHPMRLSSEIVNAMTRPDFSADFAKSPRERASEAQKRVQEIATLFSEGEIETAETELQKLLGDLRVPERQKIDALEIPVYQALKNEDFRKLNACLRRLADAFPESFQCQLRVANFIQNTDDVPAEEKDLALALECLERALALCGDMPEQRSFLFTRIADVYETRGDDSDALSARKNAWELSAEYARLRKLREKLSQNPQQLCLFDKLDAEAQRVPEGFSAMFKPEKTSAPSAENPPRVASTTPDAGNVIKFFNSLKWLRGQCPETLPQNGILFVDFWGPLSEASQNSFFRRGPARWFDEKSARVPGAQIVVLAVEKTPGRAQKELTFPRNETPHAVAVLPADADRQTLEKLFNVSAVPAVAALRDGKVIWSGSEQDLPEWIFEEATRADYDHQSASARRAKEHKNFIRTSGEISKIRNLVRQSKFNEVRERIAELQEEIEKHPTLEIAAADLLISEPFSKGEFDAVGKICERLLKKYPNNIYVAEYQMKTLCSSPNLRAQNIPLLILACRNILAAGTPYQAAYFGMLSDLYEEAGDTENAIYAAFSARNHSGKYQSFKTAKSRVSANPK